MTPDIIQNLENNAIRIFRNKAIIDPHPPITDDQLSEIEEKLSGPVPPEIINLWKTSFGGRLDYDLRVNYDGYAHSFSFSDLYGTGSDDTYSKIWTWLNKQLNTSERNALERNEAWAGKADYLPIGGVSYLERLYVQVKPGEGYGSIISLTTCMPPMPMDINETVTTTIASGFEELLDLLCFERNPFEDSDYYDAGSDYRKIIEDLRTRGPDGVLAANSLHEMLQADILDWHKSLENGSILQSPHTTALAIEDIADLKDWNMLDELVKAGCDMSVPIRKDNLMEDLLSDGETLLAERLMDCGLPCRDILINCVETITASIARKLIASGGKVNEHQVYLALEYNSYEVALILAEALLSQEVMTINDFIEFIERKKATALNNAERIPDKRSDFYEISQRWQRLLDALK